MARCYNNLADAYMCLNDYQKAIIYLQKALDVQHTTVGKYSDSLIIGYENLSVAYEQSDELEKAIDNEMNAIEVSEKVWGRIHPKTKTAYRRAGELLDYYGDYNLALKYLYEAFDIHLELSKKPSFEIADLCHEIGSIHFFMQDYDNAERMISNSVNILSDLDEQFACYPDWLLHFGQVYEKEKKYKDALEQFELSLKLYKELEDPDGIHETETKITELKKLMKNGGVSEQ
jgi:tetratricopeptide (TPR) repeat protein